MIYITASYEYVDNTFTVKDIYVSSYQNMYVLSKSTGFVPYFIEGDVVDLYDASKNCVYPLIGFSDVRVYNGDDDAKAFAKFLSQKIITIEFSHPDADKALFNVISSFGEEYVPVSV